MNLKDCDISFIFNDICLVIGITLYFQIHLGVGTITLDSAPASQPKSFALRPILPSPQYICWLSRRWRCCFKAVASMGSRNGTWKTGWYTAEEVEREAARKGLFNEPCGK